MQPDAQPGSTRTITCMVGVLVGILALAAATAFTIGSRPADASGAVAAKAPAPRGKT